VLQDSDGSTAGNETPPAAPAWKWALPLGALTIGLGLALAFMPVGTAQRFILTVGAFLLVCGVAEGGVGFANRGSVEGKAALLLSVFSLAAGAILVVHPFGTFARLAQLLIAALALRGIGAAVAAFYARPAMKTLVLCRGIFDIGIAAFLLVTVPLTVLLTVPFASLSAIFFGGGAGSPSVATLFGTLVALSFVSGGAAFLLIGLGSRRRARR
jgi:uncharacterized membrane protein HdeD (DUF308 family)